jgi:hypothetical protein
MLNKPKGEQDEENNAIEMTDRKVEVTEIQDDQKIGTSDGPIELADNSTATGDKSTKIEESKVVKTEAPEILGIKVWFLKVLFASLSMGVGQFLFAIKFTKYGVLGSGLVGPVMLIALILVKIVDAIVTKIKTGSFIDLAKSNLLNSDGSIKK